MLYSKAILGPPWPDKDAGWGGIQYSMLPSHILLDGVPIDGANIANRADGVDTRRKAVRLALFEGSRVKVSLLRERRIIQESYGIVCGAVEALHRTNDGSSCCRMTSCIL